MLEKSASFHGAKTAITAQSVPGNFKIWDAELHLTPSHEPVTQGRPTSHPREHPQWFLTQSQTENHFGAESQNDLGWKDLKDHLIPTPCQRPKEPQNSS